MNEIELGYIHRFISSPGAGHGPPLLLLHGTGGDESQLLGLGEALSPGSALLSPRGQVLEDGHARFFRRIEFGVFDEDDIQTQARELVAFIGRAAECYGFSPRELFAVGYSNGANMAASVLLLHPEVLAGAVLLHPMVPLTPSKPPNLEGVPVFISGGRRDRLISLEETERLVSILELAGADITLHFEDGGHEIRPGELTAAKLWLERVGDRGRGAS